MPIPLTICGFRLQFAGFAAAQFHYARAFLFVADSRNCSRFRIYGRYKTLAICLWNPKQQRRTNKRNNDADSATIRIFTCSGIRPKFTKSAVWHRKFSFKLKLIKITIKIIGINLNFFQKLRDLFEYGFLLFFSPV